MAKPTTYKGSLIAIYLESADSPGVYVKPCGLSEHSFTFSKNAQEVNVPDCDDPELPQWVERDVESLDFSGQGSGILAAEAVQDWWGFFNQTDSINARIYVGSLTDTDNGYYWAGKVHVTSFEMTGQVGQKAQVSIAVASDGQLTFTPVT